jgi:hypothetical protein
MRLHSVRIRIRIFGRILIRKFLPDPTTFRILKMPFLKMLLNIIYIFFKNASADCICNLYGVPSKRGTVTYGTDTT